MKQSLTIFLFVFVIIGITCASLNSCLKKRDVIKPPELAVKETSPGTIVITLNNNGIAQVNIEGFAPLIEMKELNIQTDTWKVKAEHK